MRPMRSAAVLVFPVLVALSGCVSTSQMIPKEWLSVAEAARIRSLQLAADGKVTPASHPEPLRMSDGTIRMVVDTNGPKLVNRDKELTASFLAIDSYDFSEARGEVVFSAKTKPDGGFDIGLVSSDGSPISWVPADPADEVLAAWAPRGSKISYVIRASGGDVVRTLHVPTSAQLSVPFEGARIHALAWDPPAERYAVAYSTPISSDQVEVLRYGGEDRRTEIAPAVRLDVETETFAPGALMLRPQLGYDEKLPLVVWEANDFAWSDARAALLRSARVAVVVARHADDEALWKAIESTPWIDRARTFVVSTGATGSQPVITRGPAESRPLQIVPDASLPPNHYRRSGNVVRVAPAVIQSFAAGFIADQLTRTSPTNGSSR
jgi:hypothetical protein